jgi:hypothetical protein
VVKERGGRGRLGLLRAGLVQPEKVPGRPHQAEHRPADCAGEDQAQADAVPARPLDGFLAKTFISTAPAAGADSAGRRSAC